MTESFVLVDDQDPAITVVTLNRPQRRNALCLEIIEEITEAAAKASADPARRVLILAGNGPSFCAGLDLHEASDPDLAAKSAHAMARMYETIGNSPLVTIAAAHGAAMGGGAGLLAACDFVVAADDLKLAYPEVRRGLVAALVTCLLRRKLAEGSVRKLILLGNTIGARKARELKLINAVVSAEQLGEAVAQFARSACAGAPNAIARSKQLLDALAARPLKEDLKLALAFYTSARNSAEADEGISAFMEKREPNWPQREKESS